MNGDNGQTGGVVMVEDNFDVLFPESEEWNDAMIRKAKQLFRDKCIRYNKATVDDPETRKNSSKVPKYMVLVRDIRTNEREYCLAYCFATRKLRG
jgi:hypothetical protein